MGAESSATNARRRTALSFASWQLLTTLTQAATVKARRRRASRQGPSTHSFCVPRRGSQGSIRSSASSNNLWTWSLAQSGLRGVVEKSGECSSSCEQSGGRLRHD